MWCRHSTKTPPFHPTLLIIKITKKLANEINTERDILCNRFQQKHYGKSESTTSKCISSFQWSYDLYQEMNATYNKILFKNTFSISSLEISFKTEKGGISIKLNDFFLNTPNLEMLPSIAHNYRKAIFKIKLIN